MLLVDFRVVVVRYVDLKRALSKAYLKLCKDKPMGAGKKGWV